MAEFEWDDNEFPIAYLITIRTYGTWLHGDPRGSVERHGQNSYASPRANPNAEWIKLMNEEMKSRPIILNERQRLAVHQEFVAVCLHRAYNLRALNVRTNHFHAVVSAQMKPEPIAGAFKSNATRSLREQNLIDASSKVWSRGQSRRYLWKPRSVGHAIDYTLNQQGDNLIDFETWLDLKGQGGNEP